jgi:drug/metabolite transporter (DMT)-like permease
VLIKFGLEDIPALTFAGLRYALAFLCLLPFALRAARRPDPQTGERLRFSRRDWASLALLGLLIYTVTQGSQFLGLFYLPAITVTLMLNFTSVLVAFLGIIFLAELPGRAQWVGTALFLIGALVFFYPVAVPAGQGLGMLITVIGVVGNALSSVLGRSANRSGRIPPVLVTTISMGIGGSVLFVLGLAFQGLPPLTLAHWAIIAWLAVVNTAFAFTLWNHTLRTLSAMESSIINNTMTIQIALLAWIFLDESLTLQKIVGMSLAAAGAFVVQWRRSRRSQSVPLPLQPEADSKGSA